MLNLILAILSSALVSITMRLSESRVKHIHPMLCVNYLFCLVFSWFDMGFAPLFPRESGLPLALGLGAVNGALFLAGFVFLQMNIRRNGVVLSSTFQKLGLLVSMLVSILCFREFPEPLQWLGFALAIAAILLINLRSTGEKAGSAGMLLLLLLACGTADSLSKVFSALGNSALSGHFLLYTFLSASLCCILLAAWKGSVLPDTKELFFGLVIGIPNFYSAKFLLGSLEALPAVIVYPVVNVATILTVTLAGLLFFKERLNKRQWTALSLILAALALLNL